METIFSSDSNVIMGKKLLDDDAGSQVSSIAADASDADVAYQFDIELIVEWVRRHAFKRVCLRVHSSFFFHPKDETIQTVALKSR